MKRAVRWILSGAALLVPGSVLHASGDIGCEPAWRLASRSYGSCANTALLSPGNDSRVNLFFLLRDRQGLGTAGIAYPTGDYVDRGLGHTFFSWGSLRDAVFPRPQADDSAPYGSRCISLASGSAAFAAAVAANRTLPAGERERLVAARQGIAQACRDARGVPFAAPTGIASAPGREFLGYLQAADAFYAEQWDAAQGGFARLRAAKDPWLAETAAYMLGRAELNAAQAASFDEYGSFVPGKVDRAALGRARAGLQDYLGRYPDGRYASSAQGLLRRTLWLAGDTTGLARAYERLLGAVPAGQAGAADLIEEVDNKLLVPASAKVVDGPLLLATIDLMMMREGGEGLPPVITAAQIAAQERAFADRADLYGFVQASHAFHVAKDPARVLQLIPDDARKPAYGPLAFSRQVLRGMALAARGDRNEAGFWRELLGGARAAWQRPVVELGLAMNYERTGRLADVFAAGSPIGESAIREILLLQIAGPDLLRAQARAVQRPQHERDVALFTLLYKSLTRGDYVGFLRDSATIPAGAGNEGGLWDLRSQEQVPVGLFRKATWSDGYACPALAATVQKLSADPRDVKARLCLGDFYRLNGFDDFIPGGEKPARDALGGTPTLFPGRPMARGEFYAQVIADPKAGADDKAYALFRAVNCYAPTGGNACGGADVPESQRRAWFQRLKKDYGASPWAQKLRYYW